jgi:FKBP-type peptidyl-prolyl cis-trans isomerase SlpA
MHFSIATEQGEVVDSNFGEKPVSFVLGDGNMLPGFEKYLLGLQAGDKTRFHISPADGFGEPNSANIHSFPRSKFAQDLELVVGLVVSFSDPGNNERPGVVKELSGDTVVIDFNHPLAGKPLVFEVEILSVLDVQSGGQSDGHDGDKTNEDL